MTGRMENSWGVSFSQISFLQRLLEGHDNILNVKRSHDLLFEVERRVQKDLLKILCLNEYTMSLSDVLRSLEEFGKIDIIYVGGGWCGYTLDAKKYCLDQKIGIYVTNEMSGGIWKDGYWDHHQRDDKGNTIYEFSRG